MAHYHNDDRTVRIQKWLEHSGIRILGPSVPLAAQVAVSDEPVYWADREALAYREIQEGETWGETWQSSWFRLQATVPADWAGSYVVAHIDLNGEALVFYPDGTPRCGLTNTSVFDPQYAKDILHLFPAANGGEAVDLWVEAAANGLFGVTRGEDTERLEDVSKLHGHHVASAASMRLHQFDYQLWQLWHDVNVLLDLAKVCPDNSSRYVKLLRGLNRACDAYYVDGTAAARELLAPLLAVPADPSATRVTGVGHAHIDTGWLWPVRESIRKCARTFSSALDLIERYPGYVFGASQAAHYRMVQQHYPSLFNKIRDAVAAGHWEVQGGMWVEADCNVTGGESLVRQLVHGKHYFQREFGVDVRNLWLPDVFGYSAQLPQILAKSGCPAFLTQKLSWSRYNTFPHQTFVWRGLDGSEVVAHFPPEDTYNSAVMPSTLVKCERDYRERGICDEALSLFGIGNGGGGPQEAHLERARRVADLNGLPPYSLGPAQPVLDRFIAQKSELETWSGELYLELHRGTLTTQALTKRLNRRCEEALRATEMLAAAGDLSNYPQAELDEMWKTVLLNQFHDIIPGSSIRMVYETAEAELQGVLDQCQALTQAAGARLLAADADSCTLFNPSSTPFEDVVELPAGWHGATGVPVQHEGTTVLARASVPPQSFCTLTRADSATADAAVPAESLVLENELARYELNEHLQVIAAYDKANSRTILAGIGNELSLYEDRPNNWDAWDVDEAYQDCRLATAQADGPVERLEGPVRQALRATLIVGGARIHQTVSLRPGSARLDFITQVDWQERHRMLRVAFPTTVQSDTASFEIQYGTVERPTHRNTTWDSARFEVVGHRFADLSRADWGVALLNDCKYGHRVYGGTLDLNLLRAPTDPDPVADLGEHSFTYSLLPHAGDLYRDCDVRKEAAMLNQGVVSLPGLAVDNTALPVRLDSSDGLELSVLKKAEQEQTLVVRIVETRGLASTGTLIAPGASIVPTNLVEWEDDEDNAATESCTLNLAPFEIVTVKIRQNAC